jgi:tol-pal system protein YbgF
MTRSRFFALTVVSVLLAGSAAAQDRSSGNFLDNLFNRGPQQQAQEQTQPPQAADQAPNGVPGGSDVNMRIDRIENTLRQLTGTIEQLQYQNQQLQTQLRRLQDDTDYRFQKLGVRTAPAEAAPRAMPPQGMPPQGVAPQAPAQPMGASADANGRRSDAFDPSRNPSAPGAPRALGIETAAAPQVASAGNNAPIGAPGGRAAGAPLDLSSMAGTRQAVAPAPQGQPPVQTTSADNPPPGGEQLPPPPKTNAVAPGSAQLATLPPSASPKDEYELAYGYVLHKDYGLAEQAFRDFVRKYPSEKLLPEAQFWLGESLFQQQRYRDAAESFLAVSTKFGSSSKAPDSLLRLGQSLTALHQKEAACATLAEVGRKYPRASTSVKRGVAQEQKRAHC